MSFRIFIEYTDERNLCPYDKAQFIAGVIEILIVLIMSQTDGIGSQLFDQLRISVMVFFCKSVSFIEHILMTAYSPERSFFSIDDKSFLRITGEAADTCSCGNLVIGLISSLKSSFYCVQIRTVNIPFLCVRYIKRNAGAVSRTAAAGNFFSLCI